MLAIIGGPSGADGRETLAKLHERVAEAGVIEHVSFVAPQAHQTAFVVDCARPT